MEESKENKCEIDMIKINEIYGETVMPSRNEHIKPTSENIVTEPEWREAELDEPIDDPEV